MGCLAAALALGIARLPLARWKGARGMPPPRLAAAVTAALQKQAYAASGRLGTALFVVFASSVPFFTAARDLLHLCAVRYNKPREYRGNAAKPHPPGITAEEVPGGQSEAAKKVSTRDFVVHSSGVCRVTGEGAGGEIQGTPPQYCHIAAGVRIGEDIHAGGQRVFMRPP